MAAFNVERALLSQMISTGDVLTVMRRVKSPKFFADLDNREVYTWLTRHHRKFGTIPSLDIVQDQFPSFRMVETSDGTDLLADKLSDKRLYSRLQQVLREVRDGTINDPKEGLELLRKAALELSIEHSESDDRDVTQDTKSVWDRYKEAKRNKGILGLPLPWPYLTQLSRGMRDGQFWGFYGPPGVMKTWLLLHLATFIHETTGETPVVFTHEMPKEDMQLRHAALVAKLDWGRFQGGELSREEEKKLRKALKHLSEYPPFVIAEIESTGASALAEIEAKLLEKGAKVGLIDGLTFTIEKSEWGSFIEIAKGLKSIARRTKKIIVASHHTNRSRKNVDHKDNDAMDVALGEGLFMVVDVLIRLVRQPIHEENDELLLVLRKLREGKRGSFTINAQPAYDFSQKFIMDGDAASAGVDVGDGGVIND